MFAYKMAIDTIDEYCRLDESHGGSNILVGGI
jgi:hypothetical protein